MYFSKYKPPFEWIWACLLFILIYCFFTGSIESVFKQLKKWGPLRSLEASTLGMSLSYVIYSKHTEKQTAKCLFIHAYTGDGQSIYTCRTSEWTIKNFGIILGY